MSHNPSDNSSNAVPEWDRLWNVVRETPDDFNSWEQLVRIVEAPEGGLTANSPPENMARLESVYDNFLANFPLFFGYWKKYADWELAVHGPEAAEKVRYIERFVHPLVTHCLGRFLKEVLLVFVILLISGTNILISK